MKHIILILIGSLLWSVSVSGWDGGVDVGNHSNKGRFKIPVFKSEESMVAHLEEILPAIEKGEHQEVKKLLKRGKCSGKIEFDVLEVEYSYEYNQKIKKLEKEYSGVVEVLLTDCKRPKRL